MTPSNRALCFSIITEDEEEDFGDEEEEEPEGEDEFAEDEPHDEL